MTQHEVQAGLLFPDSGPLSAEFSAFRGGVDARFGTANEQGGVHGRQLTYNWADDRGNLDQNLQAATELVGDNGPDSVVAILELTSSAAGSAQWLNEQGVPAIGVGNETVWTQYENMFAISYLTGGDAGVDTWGRFAASKGGTKAAIVYTSLSGLSQNMAKVLGDSMRAAGIEVVDQIEVTPGFTPANTVASRLAANGVDVLTGYIVQTDFQAIVDASRRSNVDLKVPLSPNGYGLGSVWPAGAYVFLDYMPLDLDLPAHHVFKEALGKYAPQLQPTDFFSAVYGWITADAYIRGLTEAGSCPTRQSFIEKLRAVNDFDADGLTVRPIDFDRDFGRTSQCFSFLQSGGTGTWTVEEPARYCGDYLPGS